MAGINSRLSGINCRLAGNNSRLSGINCRLAGINSRLSGINCRLWLELTLDYLELTVGYGWN